MTDIGRIIRVFRKKHSLTQVELAKEIGVQQSTIVRWEKGADPRPELFGRLKKYAWSLGEDLPTPWDPTPGPLSGYALLIGSVRGESTIVPDPPRTDESSYSDFDKIQVYIVRPILLEAYIVTSGMYPRYDVGDLIVVDSSVVSWSFSTDQLGIITKQDGSRYLGKLESFDGDPFNFTIVRFNAPPMVGAKVFKFQPVVGILPSGSWSRPI